MVNVELLFCCATTNASKTLGRLRWKWKEGWKIRMQSATVAGLRDRRSATLGLHDALSGARSSWLAQPEYLPLNIRHCHFLAHTMSLLVKKMKHGGPPVLSWPVIRTEALPIEQEHTRQVYAHQYYISYFLVTQNNLRLSK